MMTGTSATQDVDVSVAGASTLRLVVTDGGNGISSDHGDWASARIECGPPPPSSGYLSDMSWSSMTNGWGPVEKDMSNGEQAAGDGHPLTLNGAVFAKGLGTHAASDVSYGLGGVCNRFKASVGVDDEVA